MPVGEELVHAKSELCRVGRSLFERGYAHASAGNISIRTPASTIITPSDAPLGSLTADLLAVLDEAGQQIAGDRASKTVTLHRAIYAAASDARCIIHTHSTHLVAASLLGPWRDDELLPPITPYFVMKVGHVPLIRYQPPGNAQVAVDVAALIRQRPRLRAVMLERLGPVVWGPDPVSTLATLEELEETAKVWLLTRQTPEPLSDEAIAQLRDRFDAPW